MTLRSHMSLLDVCQYATGTLWALGAASTGWAARHVPTLEPASAFEPSTVHATVHPSERAAERTSPPRVSVVVPARDEAARIGATVTRLLGQVGVELEVLVVDDRSTDETANLVEAIARTDARVRLVRVDTLPEGWLGKPHACQRGGELARGEWILFTDGDVALAPDTLARAVALARREGVEHVVLAPDCPQRTFAASVVVNAFAVGILHEMALANVDSPRRKVGIGAFNLVRADAWRAMRGHAALAYEVVDDMRFGLLVRRSGFRTRARIARNDLQADWGGTVPRVFAVLEKNMFAQMGYRVGASLALAAFVAATWILGVTGPFSGTPAGWCAFAGFASFAIPGIGLAWREQRPILASSLAPFGFVALSAVLLHSMTRTLARGGVAWRGRLYPLATLRARRVR